MPIPLATVVALAMVVAWRSWTPIVLTVIAAAGSLAMTATGKNVIGRARPPFSLAVPPYEQSPSFPSGHTLNATVLVGVLVYLALRRLDSALGASHRGGVAGALFVLAMGLSRVFLGHHWLTDVMVGWSLGLAWLCVLVTAHRLFLTVRRVRRATGGAGGALRYDQLGRPGLALAGEPEPLVVGVTIPGGVTMRRKPRLVNSPLRR